MSFLNRTNTFFKVLSIANRSTLIGDSNRIASFGKCFYTTNTQESTRTTFASTDNQQEHFDEELIKQKILNNALKHVQSLGFTTDAIAQGANEIGYSTAAKAIFKNGAFDLVDFFYKKCNADLATYLENLVKEGKVKKKNELIRSALIYRLSLIQPVINHWPQAMAIQTFNPSHAMVSIENLLRLCDEIWHQVGDNSTDMNWYSKRLTLAGIYKSTELFMIQDKSENFKDTYQFLDNRFNDLANFNQVKNQISDMGQAITGTITVLKNIFNIRAL